MTGQLPSPRTILNQFRAGKSIFDLSLEYKVSYSRIEGVLRSGLAYVEGQEHRTAALLEFEPGMRRREQ
jgi:hypothetical protein